MKPFKQQKQQDSKLLSVILFISILLNLIYVTTCRSKPVNKNVKLELQKSTAEVYLWLTVSAEKHYVEVSWENAPIREGDYIVLAQQNPRNIANLQDKLTEVIQASIAQVYTENDQENSTNSLRLADYWSTTFESPNEILIVLKPTTSSQWFTTGVRFDYKLLSNITINTSCYGYWASYVNNEGEILGGTCMRANPTWMVSLRSIIGDLRFRDILVPGTHDSGSYPKNVHKRDTVVTKYTITQDDDVYTQLMHGIRYLDIRVGYYHNTDALFYVNHGIKRQMPLIDVINQVTDFVEETDEIVIFGLKEFPIGFGRNLSIHYKLVDFLIEKFGDLIVHPSIEWKTSLNEIWSRKQNIILAYDESSVVNTYPHTLFGSVKQRWGNAQTWTQLENYLKQVNGEDILRLSNRPIADMAELTPDTWNVITNRYGGLRRMADNINWRVSQLYRRHLIHNANIVAVDFYRGTNLIDMAIDWNRKILT